MSTPIVPNGPAGRERQAADQARLIWDNVKTSTDWQALTDTQRWEIVRRIIVWLLRRYLGISA